MENHTTNEVYDRLEEVKKQLEKNTGQEVTTEHFDTKIKELKMAIESGGKKEGDAPRPARGAASPWSPEASSPPSGKTTADGPAGRYGGVPADMLGGAGPTGRMSPWRLVRYRSWFADIQP
ncbi:hypothetical protein [Streptomyces sp. NPDC086766]|uniref:hypothetical protein n=1 Tax=Streptomyces sp. NPDC086766 TaxID=3365754 RepID=UPI0038098B87